MADFRSWDLRMNQSKYIHVITSVYRDQIIIVKIFGLSFNANLLINFGLSYNKILGNQKNFGLMQFRLSVTSAYRVSLVCTLNSPRIQSEIQTSDNFGLIGGGIVLILVLGAVVFLL